MNNQPTQQEQKAMDAGIQYGIQMIQQIPKASQEELEAHITGVLVVFWGALWGSFGTEYAKGFIESQLRSMESSQKHERFSPPQVH